MHLYRKIHLPCSSMKGSYNRQSYLFRWHNPIPHNIRIIKPELLPDSEEFFFYLFLMRACDMLKVGHLQHKATQFFVLCIRSRKNKKNLTLNRTKDSKNLLWSQTTALQLCVSIIVTQVSHIIYIICSAHFAKYHDLG